MISSYGFKKKSEPDELFLLSFFSCQRTLNTDGVDCNRGPVCEGCVIIRNSHGQLMSTMSKNFSLPFVNKGLLFALDMGFRDCCVEITDY